MRRVVPLALLALVAVLAACGSEGAEERGLGAATVVPASADLYVSLPGDLDDEEWANARRLLDRFPASDTVRGGLRDAGVTREEWQAAVGDEAAFVVVNLEHEEAVFLTQPDDVERLRELVEGSEGGGVVEEVDGGWWAAAERPRGIERLRAALAADGPLAERDDFERLTGELPEEALARMFVRGGPLDGAFGDVSALAGLPPELVALLECLGGDEGTQPAALAASAEEGGVRLHAAADRADGRSDTEEGASSLAERLPADALAFLSTRGLGEQAGGVLACVTARDEGGERRPDRSLRMIGGSLENALLPLFAGETAVALYEPAEEDARRSRPPVSPVLATEVGDEAEALRLVDELLAGAASLGAVRVETFDANGVDARRVLVQGEPVLHVGAADGFLAATGSEAGLRAVFAGGPALAGDEAYRAARAAAGAPDETAGVAYADLARLAEFGRASAPPGAETAPLDELRPLGALLLWASDDDDTVTVEGFLAIDRTIASP